MKNTFAVTLLLLAAAIATPARAADIKVLSGAVGLDERSAMMADYGLYNLHLAFASTTGEFLADVKIAIRDRKGNTVYEGTSGGPFFFASLPSGTYEVTMDFEGKAQTRKIAIGAGARPMMYVRWS